MDLESMYSRPKRIINVNTDGSATSNPQPPVPREVNWFYSPVGTSETHLVEQPSYAVTAQSNCDSIEKKHKKKKKKHKIMRWFKKAVETVATVVLDVACFYFKRKCEAKIKAAYQ